MRLAGGPSSKSNGIPIARDAYTHLDAITGEVARRAPQDGVGACFRQGKHQ
jgi:hypothetical protein